jgi:hypothetical protein
MSKIATALAAALVVASASSNAAFAATPKAHHPAHQTVSRQTLNSDDPTMALAPTPEENTRPWVANHVYSPAGPVPFMVDRTR